MPTKPVSETYLARAKRDPAFRAALLGQAMDCLTENDVATAKKMIRDCVLASMGFEQLGKLTKKKPESLMRMLSEHGNPTIKNMSAVLTSIKHYDGLLLRIEATPSSDCLVS